MEELCSEPVNTHTTARTSVGAADVIVRPEGFVFAKTEYIVRSRLKIESKETQ